MVKLIKTASSQIKLNLFKHCLKILSSYLPAQVRLLIKSSAIDDIFYSTFLLLYSDFSLSLIYIWLNDFAQIWFCYMILLKSFLIFIFKNLEFDLSMFSKTYIKKLLSCNIIWIENGFWCDHYSKVDLWTYIFCDLF